MAPVRSRVRFTNIRTAIPPSQLVLHGLSGDLQFELLTSTMAIWGLIANTAGRRTILIAFAIGVAVFPVSLLFTEVLHLPVVSYLLLYVTFGVGLFVLAHLLLKHR